MKLKYILLKFILCFLFFASCEKQEEGINGITREEITETDFLQFDQKEALQNILVDNSLLNPWKITSIVSGQNDLTSDFSEINFVFSVSESMLLEVQVVEAKGSIIIVKDTVNDDLRFPFRVGENNGQNTNFDAINTPNGSEGYKVLKNITSGKITLIGSNATGGKVSLELEKETMTEVPPVESEFLQVDQQQEFMDILENSSLESPWKIISAEFGQINLTEDFTETQFVFEAINEGAQSIAVYEPEAFEKNELSPTTTGTNEFFKDAENNDLRFQIAIANTALQLEKLKFINDFGLEGYKIRKDITNTKFILIGVNEDGETATLVFEKIVVPENEFLQITQLQVLKDILLNKMPNEAWKITFFTIGEINELSGFENTQFEFLTDNEDENVLDVGVFEPEDPENQFPSLSAEGTFAFAKDLENNDLRLLIDIETNSNELEKFTSLNNFEGEEGYKIKSNLTSNKVSLERIDTNNIVSILVFEKL
ncbi:hypothetical protein [Aquimarina agarilytica]|uniref:hypothetical protein n=1 Tax=Aquimarina agarilytica TaxID=1087449 RepID=UPI000288B9B2|nr:hypothetical protein [Aquimarina agarilytica]